MFKVPGMANLYENALRSLNFFQGAVDYWQNATPFFWVKWNDNSTWLQHNHWDHSENPGRYLYGATLTRIILGMKEELPVEGLFKEQIFKSIPEGEALSFKPSPSPYHAEKNARDLHAEQVGDKEEFGYIADLWDNRSVFTGLILNAITTGDKKALKAAENMVEWIKRMTIWEDDCAYLARLDYPTSYKASSDNDRKTIGQNMGGWISPLVFYYRQTGDEGALRVAQGYSNSFIKEFPVLIAVENKLPRYLKMNHHSFLHLIAGITRVYKITKDEELIKWAKWQFDACINKLGSKMGWTQEFMPFQGSEGIEACETCALADRIDAGIQLALAGYPEYWNDVQRCAVNYLMEAQLKDTSWMPEDIYIVDDFYRTYRDIRKRIIGAYVGWGAPNDFFEPKARVHNSIQNCCGPHGAFGVYQVWYYAVQKKNDDIYVNLAISRDSEWCTVISHQPVSGMLEIAAKCSGHLYVRIPDWADKNEVMLNVNGSTITCRFKDDYLLVDIMQGDVVRVDYNQRKVVEEELINGKNYKLKWLGDYVIGIDPEGTVAPLFKRDLNKVACTYDKNYKWPDIIEAIEW